MKRILLYIILVASSTLSFAQQDAQYSQNMFNQMAINPGYAGSNGQICATAINRQQWMGFEGAPQTTLLTVDAAINPFGIESGVGLSVVNDELGYSSNFHLQGIYAYHMDLWRGELGIGAGIGFVNKTIDGDFDPITSDDATIPEKDNNISFDLALGAFYQDNSFYAGAAVTHINQPGFELNGTEVAYLRRHYFAAAGYNFQTPIALLELKPSVFLKSDGISSQINLNANVLYNKKIWGGLSFRLNDAIIGMVGIKLFNGLKIGYSYDLSISKLGRYNQGTHEVMIGYCFDLGLNQKPEKHKSVRFL